MFTEMEKRRYKQKRRAAQAQETRQQIVEAAMALHEQLGPARTSIKAIAEQAGVQRLTVYRHFPDENSLFAACTSHWLEQHPPPELSEWADIQDALARTKKALLAFYHYYHNNQRMWRLSYRDVEDVEALHVPMAEFESYLDQVRDDLLACWQVGPKDRDRLGITLRHCLRFSTWQSLRQQKLTDSKMVELITHWLPDRKR